MKDSFVGLVATFLDKNNVLENVGNIFNAIKEGVVSAGKIFNTFSDEYSKNNLDQGSKNLINLSKIISFVGLGFKIFYETVKVSLAGLKPLFQDFVYYAGKSLNAVYMTMSYMINSLSSTFKGGFNNESERRFKENLPEIMADIWKETDKLIEKFGADQMSKVDPKELNPLLRYIGKKFELDSDFVKLLSISWDNKLEKFKINTPDPIKVFSYVFEQYSKAGEVFKDLTKSDWSSAEQAVNQSVDNIGAAIVQYENQLKELDKLQFDMAKTPEKKKGTGSLAQPGKFQLDFERGPQGTPTLSTEKAEFTFSKLLEESKTGHYQEQLDKRVKILSAFSELQNQIDQSSIAKRQTALDRQYITDKQNLQQSVDDYLITVDEKQRLETALTEVYTQKRKALAKEETDFKLEKVGEYIGYAQTVLGSLSSLNQAYASARNQEIDTETENKKAAATASIRNKSELEKELTAIDKEAAAKRRKMAKVEATINIAQAIAGTAQAVVNMLKLPPPINFILAALVGGIGAAQVAIMSAQASKLAKGGIVPGTGNTDSQAAMLTPGEVVLNKEQQARTLMAIANGISPATGTQVSIGDQTIIINGNADRAVLESALSRSRQQQMHDMQQLLKDMQYHGRLRMQIA
jgi:sarcosine oxidase gamma subunit